MRVKSLFIILLLLGVAAGGTYLLVGGNTTQRSKGVEGGSLLGPVPVNEVRSIEITSAKDSVVLHKNGEQWTVAQRYDYRADFSKVADLLRGLKDARILRAFDGSDETLKRLSLKDLEDSGASDAEKATRVVLKDQKGGSIATVLFGGEKKVNRGEPGTAGRYVRLPGEKKVFTVEGRYFLGEARPAAWLESIIINVPPEQIKRYRCTTTDGRVLYAFAKPAQGKELQPFEWTPAKKVAADRSLLVSQAISLLGLMDVAPAAQAESNGLSYPFTIEYETYGGLLYRIKASQNFKDESVPPHRLLVEVACAPGTQEASAGGQSCADQVKALNERLTPWAFTVNLQHHFKFLSNADRLYDLKLEESEDKDE